MSTVGVFSTMGYSNNKRVSPMVRNTPTVLMISPTCIMISPMVLSIPHGIQDTPTVLRIPPMVLNTPMVLKISPTFIMISPTVLNTPTVLKISPHRTEHPHCTEHPHSTAHILYRVIIWIFFNSMFQNFNGILIRFQIMELKKICMITIKMPQWISHFFS